MSDSLAQEIASHPGQETSSHPGNEEGGVNDQITSRSGSRKSQDTANAGGEGSGVRGPSIFGHHHHHHREHKDGDSDSDDSARGHGHRRGRRKRIADSASHLLAQAPALPDQRFDHNYRKALAQIHENHAHKTAMARYRGGQRVPSIAAEVTVMTIRDIIVMPFVHGFIWGFGAILFSMATHRTLGYHLRRAWRSIVGDNADDVPRIIRGEPARVRRGGSMGLGGIGLMNAGTRLGNGELSTSIY